MGAEHRGRKEGGLSKTQYLQLSVKDGKQKNGVVNWGRDVQLVFTGTNTQYLSGKNRNSEKKCWRGITRGRVSSQRRAAKEINPSKGYPGTRKGPSPVWGT